METITFDILKKNRKYFSATTKGYKCRLVIDKFSENLEIGQHQLLVNDLSVRSKYGTDLIFQLAQSADTQKSECKITLKTPGYNTYLVESCRELGGVYDRENEVWVFSDFVRDEVDDLDFIYNSEKVAVEITIDGQSEHNAPICVLGFIVAAAKSRDSGANVSKNIAVISGGFDSAGSIKNWRTISEDGTVIRMELPCELLKLYSNDLNYKLLTKNT